MASISAKTSVSAKAALRPRAAARSTVKVCAKYGEDSRYFDLKDMENSTGSWDMYGQDSDKRYASMQNTFFTQAADVLTRREALRAFVALSGVGAIVTFGLKGSLDADLPITKAPTKTENGKGGSVRSRI